MSNRKKLSDFGKEAQHMIEKLLEDYPDVQAAVLLVDYDPALKNADLPACFMTAQSNEFSELQRFHSMCLHGASAVNTQVMNDLQDLYRTTDQETKGVTEDDS